MASNYSYGELMNMQEDAIRRVREMQRRANIAKDSANESFGYQSRQHSQPVSQYNNNNYQQDSQREAPESNHIHQPQNISSPQYHSQSNESNQEQTRQNHQQSSHQTRIESDREPQLERNEGNREPDTDGNEGNREPHVNRDEENRNQHANQRQNQNRNRNSNNTNNQNPFSSLFNDPTLKSIFGNEGLGSLSGILGNNGLNVNAILEKMSDPLKGEQILLLGMLILLSNEGADRSLLVAILYIMMD